MGVDSILLICAILALLAWYIVVPYRKFKREENRKYPSPDGPVTITKPDHPPLIQLEMPNGALEWAETHHEIVSFIALRLEKHEGEYLNSTCPVVLRHEEHGTGGLYELGIEWTDEFEKKYAGVAWGEELEYFDEMEKFLESKINS